MKKVFVVDGSAAYYNLMLKGSFEVVGHIELADLVLFTGGEDVDSSYYGEPMHPKAFSSKVRDIEESLIFDACLAKGIPMVGICRGGQFLNVKSGGRMYQHVTNHCGDHYLICKDTGQRMIVSSTHHQMMRPSNSGYVIAHAQEGGVRESVSAASGINSSIASKQEEDCEVVFYAKTKCLCFQPHPEFLNADYETMTSFFFECIKNYLL